MPMQNIQRPILILKQSFLQRNKDTVLLTGPRTSPCYGLISPPYYPMSLAAECSPVLLPLRFGLSSALQYEIVMLSAIEHSVPRSLQTSKRIPSSLPAYPVHRSGQHPRILPRQLEGVSRTVVHLRLIEEVEVTGLNLNSAYHYSHAV